MTNSDPIDNEAKKEFTVTFMILQLASVWINLLWMCQKYLQIPENTLKPVCSNAERIYLICSLCLRIAETNAQWRRAPAFQWAPRVLSCVVGNAPLPSWNAVVQTALSLTAMDVETLVLLQHLIQDEVWGLPLNSGTLFYISCARYLMLEFFFFYM